MTPLDPVGKLLGDAWQLYKKQFFTYLGIILLPSIIFACGYVLISYGPPTAIIIGVLIAVIAAIAMFFSVGAILLEIMRNDGFVKSYEKVSEFVWPMFLIFILFTVIQLGGFILLIIPGILMTVWFIFWPYVLIAEGKRGLDALTQSREYVREYWWAIFWRFLVVEFIEIIASLIISFIIFIFLPGVAKQEINGVSSLIRVLLYPFYAICFYLVYKNLVIIKPNLQAAQSKKGRGFLIASGIVGFVVAILIIPSIFFVRTFVVEPFSISGQAMSPTLTNGEYVLIEKFNHNYKQGDIVILRDPQDETSYLVKRIIGLPGDSLDIHDGNVYVNGRQFNEASYLGNMQTPGNVSTTLAENEFFVLGDNRTQSFDSRDFGSVNGNLIVGKFWFTLTQ